MLPSPGQWYMVPDTVTRSRHPVTRTTLPDHGQYYLVLDNFTWSMTTQSGPGQYYLVLSRMNTTLAQVRKGADMK